MLVQNSVNLSVKTFDKNTVNTKNENISNEQKNINIGIKKDGVSLNQYKTLNDSKIAPVKLFSDNDKFKTAQFIFSGSTGALIATSAAVSAKIGYTVGSAFGTKGAIIGAAITGTTGALLAGSTAGAVDERLFDNKKAMALGGAVTGAAFVASHTLKNGTDLKSSALLIGAGALVGAGIAVGSAYASDSTHKKPF